MCSENVNLDRKPELKTKIPWASPDLTTEEQDAAISVIRSGWMTQGKVTAEFERDLAQYCNAQGAVVVCNGTAALITSLIAHGIGPGDEILVPTFTFAASVNSILAVGARPILMDCDRETFNVTPELALKKIGSRTKGIMVVDICGMPVDLNGFTAICQDRNLTLIEDAAQAFGAGYKDRKTGGLGHTTTFSFHIAKQLAAVEGGCITSNDRRIIERCRSIRNHGMEGSYRHTMFGLNFRSTDIQSAIGIVQLRKVDRTIAKRNSLCAVYTKELEGLATFQKIPPYVTTHPRMIFMALFDPSYRDGLKNFLDHNGVETKICWPPIHGQPFHSSLFHKENFPNADYIHSSAIALPMGNALSQSSVLQVCMIVKSYLEDRH
jgi:dTDP-4-amino-4,6-dideoxygalactose transaminase